MFMMFGHLGFIDNNIHDESCRVRSDLHARSIVLHGYDDIRRYYGSRVR